MVFSQGDKEATQWHVLCLNWRGDVQGPILEFVRSDIMLTGYDTHLLLMQWFADWRASSEVYSYAIPVNILW